MNEQSDLSLHEHELRRLLTRHAHDPLIRAILTLDVAIRRAARRLLAPSESRAGYPTSR